MGGTPNNVTSGQHESHCGTGAVTAAARPARRRRDRLWICLALLAAFASAVMAPFAGGWTHPPEVKLSWLLCGALGLVALLASLWASRVVSGGLSARLSLGLASLVALASLIVPVTSYYMAFNDLPWAAAAVVVLLTIVGGWTCRQRWLTFAMVGFVAFLAAGAAIPPTPERLPRTSSIGQLTVSLHSLERHQGVVFSRLSLAGPPGVPLEHRYDIQDVLVRGSVLWGLLPVHAWSQYELDREPSPPEELVFAPWLFPPHWTRSFDLVVEVPRWPEKPVASLTFTVPGVGQPFKARPAAARHEDLTAALMDAGWSYSTHRLPPERCLKVAVELRGPLTRDVEDMRLRYLDQNGRLLPSLGGVSSMLTEEEHAVTYEDELFPADKVTRVNIDIFEPERLDAGRLQFRFRGLPNPGERAD